MSRGANVTVTIGAAFAGSFKSVLREADRELKQFGKRASKSMRSADRDAGRLGKSIAGIERAAVGAHRAIGSTVKELEGMKAAATHTRALARDTQSVARWHRDATKAARGYTRETVRGARVQARAQAKAARSLQPVSLARPGSTAGLPPCRLASDALWRACCSPWRPAACPAPGPWRPWW
ncbi:hypothetical protein MKK88_03420 [Methylobacterium sp. E-005]|nr:hypothetical protein [Methylobacterium sp. E-005]